MSQKGKAQDTYLQLPDTSMACSLPRCSQNGTFLSTALRMHVDHYLPRVSLCNEMTYV